MMTPGQTIVYIHTLIVLKMGFGFTYGKKQILPLICYQAMKQRTPQKIVQFNVCSRYRLCVRSDPGSTG